MTWLPANAFDDGLRGFFREASGTARVGVRQGCPLSPTLFGIFFDSLDAQFQAEPAAGVECRGVRVPGMFYADDVALLSPSAQGLQQLLDTMQSFCVTNGLTISVLKTEVVVFGGGHQQCQWHVGGHRLKRSESFIYLGMLFHEDRRIKHAVQHRLARGYAAQGSIFSRYAGLGCANSVQLLVRLQQAILQPCASYACEVWAPASACIGPFRNLQQLQRAFLCRACRVKKNVPVDIIFQELQQMRWHDFWWRRVSSFWSALVEADTGSLHSMIFHDAIQLALAGCKFSWAAQVLQCFSALDEPLPLVADAPIAIDINLLQEFSCGTGLRALTACLRIPDWPRRLVSNFARITAGLGGPKMQLAHLIGSHQWEMPSCTGFSGFAWGHITSQLRRAAISTCLGPVVSATCAILMH